LLDVNMEYSEGLYMIYRVNLFSNERFRHWIDIDVPEDAKRNEYIKEHIRNYCRNNKIKGVNSIGIEIGNGIEYIKVKPVRRIRGIKLYDTVEKS